jgi:hypothetical protein
LHSLSCYHHWRHRFWCFSSKIIDLIHFQDFSKKLKFPSLFLRDFNLDISTFQVQKFLTELCTTPSLVQMAHMFIIAQFVPVYLSVL